MKKRGSVTVFFSLFMTVLLVFIQVIFRSVQIAGGKIQAEAGVEEGLYSVFAGYHRELLNRYHVFLLDAGYGTGKMQPGCMYQIIEASLTGSCSPGKTFSGIRGENMWKTHKKSGAILGYTLAADQNGRAFKMQAVDYMKDTVGIQGIQLLLEQNRTLSGIIKALEMKGSSEQAELAMKTYEEERTKAEQTRVEAETNGEEFVNPLEIIGQLRDRGILALVLTPEAAVSRGKLSEKGSLADRTLERGMGTLFYRENTDAAWSAVIFQEYMIQHLESYTDQGKKENSLENGLSYQLEYAIAGKKTDMDNLKTVAAKLLAVREASNMVFLLQDPSSQAQIHEMALAVCSYVGVPFLEGVVSLALQAAWAFGESVLDVRHLLRGGEVPLIKTSRSWNLSLNGLGKITQELQKDQGKQQNGMSYEEYLRVLLFMGNRDEQVLRTMDIAEQEIKKTEGNGNFRIDLCMTYLKVEMRVTCCGQEFFIQRDYGYEM